MTLDSKILMLLLIVCALTACAHADCAACIEGLCHNRQQIVAGHPVTDQLAIDRTNNVLYLQFYDILNKAVILDNHQQNWIVNVNTKRTKGKAVNQETHDLYLGSRENDSIIYKYSLLQNKTYEINVENYGKKPQLMFSSGNHLFFIDNKTNSINVHDLTATTLKAKLLRNTNDYLMSDFVIGEGSQIFFVTNDGVYVYKAGLDPVQSPKLITRQKHVLSVDKNGTVYFANTYEKVIMKWNKTTEELKMYAFYSYGKVDDFLFDNNNNIVFRYGDLVAKWVPAPENLRCGA